MHKTFFLLCCLIPTLGLSQKMKLLSGDLRYFKGQRSFGIMFTYDSLLIGDNTPESIYLKEKKASWDEKDPDTGSEFIRNWFNARKDLYKPAFIENFEEQSNIKLDDGNAPYTLIVKTRRTEGGWSAGVISHPGEIDGELWIVDTSDKTKVLAKVGFYNFHGNNLSGGDIEMTFRIQDAYAIAGKGLGYFLKKRIR